MTLYYSLLFLVIILVEMKPQFQTKSNISNLNSSYYFSHWCGKGLEILEDASCKKIFPSSFSRNFSCPIYSFENYNLPSNGYYSEDIGLENIQIDSTTLSSIINVSINLCMILTKRVRSIESATGKVTTKLFNKYFCYQNSSTFASETWSSSKIFAMANAAGHLRTNASSCVPDSLGLDAATTGKHNVTQLGDLSTIITSYDSTAGYSSNGLSSYFHDLGERSRLFNLVNSAWLGLPYPVSLGGNYGEATPADLSFDLFTGCNTESSDTCAVAKDTTGEYENTLSSLAHAELLRRIVLHREVNPSLRFPNVTWADIQEILYGSENSTLFPGQLWGGTTSDTAIFSQSALDMERVDRVSNGQWRIFSKRGNGYSTSRLVGEIVTNAYLCLPDASMQGGGVEVSFSGKGSVPGDTSLIQVQTQLLQGVTQALQALVAGKIY